jgi:hypothetical protein
MRHNCIETNLKVIKGGTNLQLSTKIITLIGEKFDINDIQKVCSHLSHKYRIAATPYSIEPKAQLLINERDDIEKINVNLKKGMLSFKVIFEDKNELLRLDFKNVDHRHLLADLYKRALIIKLNESKRYWTFDTSRIFYEKKPFIIGGTDRSYKVDDISAFRRYEISEVILDNGIAISVDVGTAFFTNKTVDYYFKNNEQERFNKLTNRQLEQKGTLLYKSPTGYSKCYFIKYDETLTCGATNSFTSEGIEYKNLFDYYKQRNKQYQVTKGDNIAFVNFPGLQGDLPVAANKLFIRVMNDMLPNSLSQSDKISPDERDKLLNNFWQKIGKLPFGEKYLGLDFAGRNYRPYGKTGELEIPDLIFGARNTLLMPKNRSIQSYKENFKDRKKFLLNYGCFFNPLTITRDIYFVYPDTIESTIIEDFSNDICDISSQLVNTQIEPIIEKYSDLKDMVNSLNREKPSMVVFIFDKFEPAAYFTISHELKNWNIKRATSYELKRKHKIKKEKPNFWNSYIELNTFDILQQLGCVLWTCPPLHYDIYLAVDVSDKFTHFCFSLFMYNNRMDKPIIKTDTYTKTNRKEKINQTILENKLNSLFEEWSNELIQSSPKKMLIIRDGKVCEGELMGITNTIKNQISKRNLPIDFDFDIIEYHKTSLKGIRLWQKNGLVTNVLEGTYFIINKNNALLVPTGAATLRQGTAHPILIKIVKSNTNFKIILQDIFSLSQLNFSSPSVAQSFCFPIKRADEQLKDRKIQEVERIK